MANQDRVNFVWAETALTTIPPIPVSEVAYRDTTQTPEQMEVGQQYDTIYNSARHNQLLFLLTSVAKTLCENGIMPFLAGQEYSQYARCIFTDGKLYTASRAILANEQPYPTPGDDSGVWIAEETSENLVPNSRRVIAGTGLTGGGPLSSDVTLSAKLDGKTVQAAADGAITVKDVAIEGDIEDLASARGQIGNSKTQGSHDFSSGMLSEKPGMYTATKSGSTNVPFTGPFAEMILGTPTHRGSLLITSGRPSSPRAAISAIDMNEGGGFSGYNRLITEQQVGDGIRVSDGIISVPEYDGATASTAGTAGLVPPAAAGEQESFLTGGGEYKPALSTKGGLLTGSVQINDTANVISTAPTTNSEHGLFVADKNGAIKGGFDSIQRSYDNAKWTQLFSKASGGTFASLGVVAYEDGTGEVITYNPLLLNTTQLKEIIDNGNRVFTLGGDRSKPGYTFRFSPDTGEAYMDGRAIHAKADTAGYADTAGSAGSAMIAAPAVQWVVNLSGPQITVPLGGTYNVVCICFNDSGGKGAVKHYPNIAGGTVIPNAHTDYMVAGLCARVA